MKNRTNFAFCVDMGGLKVLHPVDGVLAADDAPCNAELLVPNQVAKLDGLGTPINCERTSNCECNQP